MSQMSIWLVGSTMIRKRTWLGLRYNSLAERFLETGNNWLIGEDAARIVNGVLPGRDFSRSLYRGMVDEGVLLEDMRGSRGGDSREIVSIAFERFADHVVAEVIIQNHLDRNRSVENIRKSTYMVEAFCQAVPASVREQSSGIYRQGRFSDQLRRAQSFRSPRGDRGTVYPDA